MTRPSKPPRPATPAPTPSSAPAPAPAPALAPHERLESLLADLIAEHERLLPLVERHRRAIATADAPALDECLAEQARAASRLADLDRQRRALADRALADRAARSPVTLTDLAAAAPEPARTRLLDLASRLRSLVRLVQREQAALRLATEALLGHISAVVRQVALRLSDTATYTRRGALEPAAPAARALDLRR